MLNGSQPPTLADLIRMDWLILENKRAIGALRRLIDGKEADASNPAEEHARYEKLLEEQKERIAERQAIREYFANQGR
jgi:hypothetical protein